MKLRIISGIAKGRLISVPKSKLVRPTTDKVRESLFNILSNRISLEGSKILDLYAGSGSLGLECFSRGAKEVHFVEQNHTVCQTLRENINSLNANSSCKVYKISAVKFATSYSNCNYDLILADPPFFKDDIYEAVENLLSNKYLAEDGMLIIERSIQSKDNDIENFKTEPFRIMGDSCLYEIKY